MDMNDTTDQHELSEETDDEVRARPLAEGGQELPHRPPPGTADDVAHGENA